MSIAHDLLAQEAQVYHTLAKKSSTMVLKYVCNRYVVYSTGRIHMYVNSNNHDRLIEVSNENIPVRTVFSKRFVLN